MIIGNFLVGPPAKLRGRAYAEFHNRLKPLVKFEMNGLSFKGATVVKPTSSNWCTLYILNNGAQLIKYRSRYAIVAATRRALDETSKLLQVSNCEIIDTDTK